MRERVLLYVLTPAGANSTYNRNGLRCASHARRERSTSSHSFKPKRIMSAESSNGKPDLGAADSAAAPVVAENVAKTSAKPVEDNPSDAQVLFYFRSSLAGWC